MTERGALRCSDWNERFGLEVKEGSSNRQKNYQTLEHASWLSWADQNKEVACNRN